MGQFLCRKLAASSDQLLGFFTSWQRCILSGVLGIGCKLRTQSDNIDERACLAYETPLDAATVHTRGV
jgi:hypothetical protein